MMSGSVLLQVIQRIVDVSETNGFATTNVGVDTVDNDAIGGRFVHLGQLFADDFSAGSGFVAVVDVDDHLLSVEEPIGHVFSGRDGDGHFCCSEYESGKKFVRLQG